MAQLHGKSWWSEAGTRLEDLSLDLHLGLTGLTFLLGAGADGQASLCLLLHGGGYGTLLESAQLLVVQTRGNTQVSSEGRGQTTQLTSKLGGSPLLEVAGRAPCCGREDGCPGIHQASGEERGPVGRRRVCLVLVHLLLLLLLHLPLHPSAWRTPMQTPHGKLLTSPPEGYQHSKIKIYSNLS